MLLVNDRIADPLLATAEHLPAATALRQMLKPPIDALWRDHLPGLALMTGLATRAAHRPLVSLARQTTTLGPRLGGSDDGGIELFRESRPAWRSSSSI